MALHPEASLRAIDESLSHASRAWASFRRQGQHRMAAVALRKIDGLLDTRLLITTSLLDVA
jgi:hypothetical protein